MIEAVIQLLIYIVILAIVVYLVVWVLGIVGVPIPAKVLQLIWVVVALIAILLLVRMVLPHAGWRIGWLPALLNVT